MGWSGTVIEQVPEMRSAARAFYFITRHPMTVIRHVGYLIFGQRRIETGPGGARVELRIGTEELIRARRTDINSLFVVVPIRVLIRRLSFGFTQHLKLSGSQNLSPLVITQRYLPGDWYRVQLPSNPSGLSVFTHAETNRKGAQQ